MANNSLFVFCKFFTRFFPGVVRIRDCIKSIGVRKNSGGTIFSVGEETVIKAFREPVTATSKMENN